jgi:Mg-chelatase subunit ChlD
MADDKPTSEDSPKDWRGPAISAGHPAPKYAWQSDEREAAPLHARKGSIKRRLRILGLGLLTLAISAFFLAELLFSQLRTPMIVIAPADYEFPFQPLSWSQEDLEGFRELDRETLNVQSIEAGWKTKDQGLRQLDSQLQNILNQRTLPETVVLYLRMHAAVDGTGIPCIVAPGSSPFNADSWIPIKDVLERFRVQHVPNKIYKLVILDCSSVLSDWNQGIVFNTFTTRLPSAVTEAGVPNLAVITAAGPAEISATSTALRQGVFGHFLERGLAGAADAEFGNRDRLVSIYELHRYLQEHVNTWSLRNRNRPQQPQLIPADVADFPIATSFNPSVRKHAKIESRLAVNAAAAVSANEVAALWKKFEDCQRLNPFRFDPVAWTDFEQRLRWIERALESGKAYGRTARRIYQDLQQRVASIEQFEEAGDRGKTLLSQWATFSADPLSLHSTAKINTAPLAQLFGTMGPASTEGFAAVLAHFKRTPSASSLHDTIQSLTANVEWSHLELTCLLQLWQRYEVLRLWPDPTVLSSVVELHELAESASAPMDERSIDWIRPVVDAADVMRRKVDDQIFLGGNPPLKEISEAQQTYHQALQMAASVARAYEIRDRIDHELVYLAQWLLRPRFDGLAPSTAFLEHKSQILELMRNQRSLERALSQPVVSMHGDLSQLPFQGLVTNIESQYERLFGQLVSEYERLLQSDDAHPATWNDIHDLLSVPLLPPRNERLALAPSQQRNLLREKSIVIERKLVDRFAESTWNASQNRHLPNPSTVLTADAAKSLSNTKRQPDSARMAEYLDELLIEVPENLGLTIIRRDDSDEVDDSKLMTNSQSARSIHEVETIADMQGRFLRLWMKSVPDVVQNETERQLLSNEKRVFQNCLAEKNARASATVAPTRLADDPITLRRYSDLQTLLLWHTQRVLEDFWGRGSHEQASFFDFTAGNLMKVAESIGRLTMSSQSEIAELNSRLKKYRVAAAEGLTTVSDNLLIPDDAGPATAKIAVYPTTKHDSVFPPGNGAVFVLNTAGERLSETYPLIFPWSDAKDHHTAAAQFDVQLRDVDHRIETLSLKAVTSFRGHDYIGDLTVNSVAGIVVDYQPQMTGEARIAIRGRRTRKLSMVFVLDCSNSMGQQLSLTGDNQTGSRLQVAKLALESMLDKLAEAENHRVGVICFGHRVGWDLKQPGLFLRQTEYSAPIPDQMRPFDDVETILPLGRFNASFAGAVNERLASIKPWGESPLYLALIQALKMFDQSDQDSDRCVVVITDGANYQFNPPAAARKTVYDVLAAWNDHQVPIHIVGLGMGADQAASTQREFDDLARKTDGTYVSAQEARTLVESLAALQRISQFRVRSLTGGEEHHAELGQPITVETIPHRQNLFEVALGTASEQVLLRGGEALELVPTRDERRLDVLPYEVGQPQFVPLVRDDKQSSVTDLTAGIHRPFRRGQKVTFEVSVQHPQRHFVARPTEVWLEIIPILPPGQSPPAPYVFYDAHYVPNTTVPILRWTVTDWPIDAKQAKVRFWCRMDESKPTTTIALREATDSERDPDFRMDGIPGVSLRVRVRQSGSLQISFVERHANDSAGVGSLKVGFKSSVVPSRVRHRFDAANRIATHFFEFSTHQNLVLSEGEIQLTTRTAAQMGALRIPDAIVVDVTESGDVHN